MTDFERFWAAFPRRVGKLNAMKAYAKSRKTASAEDILAGVERYIARKPEYADWCHPTTWLNQGRWMDEDDRRELPDRRQESRQTPERRTSDPVNPSHKCPHTPPCTDGRFKCMRRSQMADFQNREAS